MPLANNDADAKAQVAALLDGAPAGAPRPRSKRGRKPKAEAEAPVVSQALPSDALVPLLGVWNAACRSRGSRWEFSESETAQLSAALVPVVNKYLPVLSGWEIEITALLTVVSVVVPRLGAEEPHGDLSAERQADVQRDGNQEIQPGT